MIGNHIPIDKLPYCKKTKKWLTERYGESQAKEIWQKTVEQYNEYLLDTRFLIFLFFQYIVKLAYQPRFKPVFGLVGDSSRLVEIITSLVRVVQHCVRIIRKSTF